MTTTEGMDREILSHVMSGGPRVDNLGTVVIHISRQLVSSVLNNEWLVMPLCKCSGNGYYTFQEGALKSFIRHHSVCVYPLSA